MQLMTENSNDTALQNQASTFPIVVKIVESLKKILEEDKKQKNPLFYQCKRVCHL